MSFAGALDAATALHWLRPDWLWALAAVLPLIWWWRRQRRRASVWRQAVDPHLLPHLLERGTASRGRVALASGLLGYVLAVVALAGPSWRQVEQPLWQSHTPLVIALDLSSATLAGDVPPTRLAQARAKLATLLRDRDGGQVGLVAYAGDAFTVAPLTGDAANVALFLDALHPEVMPVDGQRSDRAIAWSAKLLRQAGFESGEILLLTDHADAAAREAAAAARQSGFRVSALGMGSEAGAPYRQPHGGIATARLDADSLRGLAQAGGGAYSALTSDSGDLRLLGVLTSDAAGASAAQSEGGRSWQDEGYWLLLPLMLLALLAFRRGSGAAAVLLICLWMPGQPALAAGMAAAASPPPDASSLWRRPDQIAHQRMQQAEQAYRQGDFARATQLYQGIDNADAHYNRGNALAKGGRYPQAIAAYDEALQLQPGMPDAIANKRAVEAAMKRQPPPGPQEGQQDSQNPQPGQGEDADPSQQGQAAPDSPPHEADSYQSPSTTPPAEPPPAATAPADAKAQEAADAAQRERMQRALEQANGEPEPSDAQSKAKPQETTAQRERRIANEAWLRRVPDDPGGLLREKFRIEHQRRQLQGEAE